MDINQCLFFLKNDIDIWISHLRCIWENVNKKQCHQSLVVRRINSSLRCFLFLQDQNNLYGTVFNCWSHNCLSIDILFLGYLFICSIYRITWSSKKKICSRYKYIVYTYTYTYIYVYVYTYAFAKRFQKSQLQLIVKYFF